MAVVNCRKHDNEVSTKTGTCQKYGVPIPKSRMDFKAMGGILALSFVVTMQSTYGSEPAKTSPTAAATQASPAISPPQTPKTPGFMGLSSPASGSEKTPEIVWEPIGKYSQKEINLVSDTVGKLFDHMKKMEAIESSVAPLVRSGYQAEKKEAMLSTAKKYSADAQEESKKIDQFKIPAIKNKQATEMILKAKAALKNASEIQKDRASKVTKMASGDGDVKVLSDEIQQLGSRRISAAFQFVNAYMAYESYGFTSDQIDQTTGRLKKDAKPDRLPPESQTAPKNTP